MGSCCEEADYASVVSCLLTCHFVSAAGYCCPLCPVLPTQLLLHPPPPPPPLLIRALTSDLLLSLHIDGHAILRFGGELDLAV